MNSQSWHVISYFTSKPLTKVNCPLIPIACDSSSSILCCTLSNSFSKSIYNTSTGHTLSKNDVYSSSTSSKLVTHDLLCRNPCWLDRIKPKELKSLISGNLAGNTDYVCTYILNNLRYGNCTRNVNLKLNIQQNLVNTNKLLYKSGPYNVSSQIILQWNLRNPTPL